MGKGPSSGQPFEFKDVDRFWRKVRRGVLDECWLWEGYADPVDGYGRVRLGSPGKLLLAHRVAWTIAHGPIPAGESACHRCDVKLCCNLDHLFLGTHQDNMRDMREKGRAAHPAGERHPQARLTWPEVREIRSLLGRGEFSKTEIGRRFGIGRSQVIRIERYEMWK